MHRLGTVSKEIIGDLNWLNGSNLTLNSDMYQNIDIWFAWKILISKYMLDSR